MSSGYSLSMSGSSLRRPESLLTARLYLDNYDWQTTKAQVVSDNLYQLNAESSRKRVATELIKRLSQLNERELRFLVDSYGDDQSAMFWVAVCRTYQFVADLSVDVIAGRYDRSVHEYTMGAFEEFFDRQAELHPELRRLSRLGHDKMRNTVFRLLVECRLVSQSGTCQYGEITPIHPTPSFRDVLDFGRMERDLLLFPGVMF
jgi:hypothetical protein